VPDFFLSCKNPGPFSLLDDVDKEDVLDEFALPSLPLLSFSLIRIERPRTGPLCLAELIFARLAVSALMLAALLLVLPALMLAALPLMLLLDDVDKEDVPDFFLYGNNPGPSLLLDDVDEEDVLDKLASSSLDDVDEEDDVLDEFHYYLRLYCQ
jgi:hypothetical protein